MSSAVVSTSAALGRPFVFDEEADCSLPNSGPSPEKVHVGTAPQACPERSRRGCPVERSSTDSWQHPLHSTINDKKIPPASVTPASQLEIRPAPEMVSSGIPALDALTGGLPRGCLTEICGPASSGRTTVLLAALAAATRRDEFCALIDASDTLDPHSATAAGVDLDHLLWVRCGESSPQKENSPHRHPSTSLRAGSDTERKENQEEGCPISRAPFAREVGISPQATFEFDRTKSRASEHRLEQVLRATDLLLESGGFGLIILDLADLPPQSARRIPLTTWFRFRRAVEYKPTILLAIEQHPIAGSCSSLLLQLGAPKNSGEKMNCAQSNPSREAAEFVSPGRKPWVVAKRENQSRRDDTNFVDTNYDHQPAQIIYPTHAHLLTGLQINAELIRSRLDRKPAHSVTFATKTAWAG